MSARNLVAALLLAFLPLQAVAGECGADAVRKPKVVWIAMYLDASRPIPALPRCVATRRLKLKSMSVIMWSS